MLKPLCQLSFWSWVSPIASVLGGISVLGNIVPVQAQNVVIRYSVISPYYSAPYYNAPAAPLLLTPGGFVPLQSTPVYPGSYVCVGSCPGTSSIASPSGFYSPLPNATAPIYAPNGIRNSTLVNPTIINSPIYNSTLINPQIVQPIYPTAYPTNGPMNGFNGFNGFAAPVNSGTYPLGTYPGGYVQPSVTVFGR